jgi:hypothetical protein
MTTLRSELEAVLAALLRASEQGPVSLDAVGEALGSLFVTPPEIEALLDALEARGVNVEAPQGGSGELYLARVVATVRTLTQESGQKPTLAAVATRSGLSVEQVRHALALLRIMQR